MPGGCLRHRRSFRSLRISPLHRKFRHPLIYSSDIVCDALPRLSPGLSHHTHITAYAPFTPSNSDQRSHPLYYRGCWHRVCRCLFCWYRQPDRIVPYQTSSQPKGLYNPKAFFTHAASLDQGCPHCPRFPTAASRRSLGRVSVPV